MDGQQAFLHFVEHALAPDQARRFSAISSSKKGRQKILAALFHVFDPAIEGVHVETAGNGPIWDSICYVFHQPLGFGVEFPSMREAFDSLSISDGWLIVSRDGLVGIYRPEDRWDATRIIILDQDASNQIGANEGV